MTDNFGTTQANELDPVFKNGNSKSNIGMDLGLLWKSDKKFSAGIMVQDINEPSMALSSEKSSPLPRVFRFGLNYQNRTLALSGQINSGQSAGKSKQELFYTAGAEKWWLSNRFTKADMALRGSLMAGSKSFSQAGMGASFRLGNVQADYGFAIPLKDLGFGTTQGNHQITLSVRFGQAVAQIKSRLSQTEMESMLRTAFQQIEYYKQERQRIETQVQELQHQQEERSASLPNLRLTQGEQAQQVLMQRNYEDLLTR